MSDHAPAPAAAHVAATDPHLPEPSRGRSSLFALATATGAAAVLIAVVGIYVLTGTM